MWHTYLGDRPDNGDWIFAIWGQPGKAVPQYGVCRYFATDDEDWCEMDGSECSDPDYWTPIPAPPPPLDIYYDSSKPE